MFLETLNKLMDERGLNKNSLSRQSGIPYTTIDGFYKKGYANAKLSTLRQLAHFFEVSLDYLVGEDTTNDNNIMSDKEKKMLTDYRELNEIGQQKAQEYIRLLLMDSSYKKLPPLPQEEEYAIAAWGGKNEVKTKTIKPQTT